MADEVKIVPINNGPLKIEGVFKVMTPSGKELMLKGNQAFLCRCGASENKPFCDGAHNKCGFRASEEDIKTE
jgi:CDGSH-type Zn-finger protein